MTKTIANITYTVITNNDDCGHMHRTRAAAEACLAKLTRRWCECGHTTASHAPCCGRPQKTTSAHWYNASIEPSDDEYAHAEEQWLRAQGVA